MGSPRSSHYRLVAGPARHQLGPSGALETELWLYNAVSPGPAIVADEGDELVVDFTNNLEQPTTIHWHGIRNVNEMDGVPGLTQLPIEPGETFAYRFPVNYAGTYWYHAHNKAWEQVTRGLYGPLIVNDSKPISVLDIVLLADDWRLKEDYQLEEASLGSLRDWSHQGRLGNRLTINGQDQPVIKLQRDSFVRLRFINSANARTLEFEIEGRAV
jgi:FtsP/CotA-like multicopper oxidase with cupredoxin domain